MGIPILSDILDMIRWTIDFFVNTVPRPIKIIIFLVLILVFGNIFLYSFHLVGIHCQTDKTPVKTELLDVATNTKVLYETTVGTLNTPNATFQEAHPLVYYAQLDVQCAYLLKQDGDDYVFCDNINDTGCNYYLREADCHNCTAIDVGWLRLDGFPYWTIGGEVCGSDAYFKDKNWFSRNLFCELNCEIPEHYYFDYETGLFICNDLDYCGENATLTPDSKLDVLLDRADAEIIYTDSNPNDYRKVFKIGCNADFHPRITLFGKLDIFDYKIWLVLIVLASMVIFLTKISYH